MSAQSINSSDIFENGSVNESLSDVDDHTCTVCELKFNKPADLELHCQLHDKNNDYKCSLCSEIFTDLEQLKLHDLRHSLEEAEEDVTDIEQMILPFGLKSCDVCGEKFSCDEELINHSMNHPEILEDGNSKELAKSVAPEEDDTLSESDLNASKEDCVSADNEDAQTNYQILRQEVFKDESGRTDIRFILIDHQNEQVEEYTHTILDQTKRDHKKKTFSKRNGNIVPSKTSKKAKAIKKRKHSDDDDVVFIKSEPSFAKKYKKSDDKDVKSDDDDVIICEEEFDDKSRRCKQIALKRKLWKEKVYLPPAQKLRDCPTCNKSFGDIDVFNKHILTHKPKSESGDRSTIYGAANKKTPKKFVKDQIKKTPIKTEKDQDNEDGYPEWIEITCEICYNRFCTKKGLRKHLINVHKLDLKKVNYYVQKIQYNTASYHTCKVCKKQFYRESRLSSHDCTPALAVVCEICSQKLSSKSGLKRHLMTAHKLEENKLNSILEQLSEYNARFYKKLDTDGEVTIRCSDGRLVSKKRGSKFCILQGSRCKKCNKALTDEDESEKHKCFHKIELICDVCKYNSSSKYNLRRHIVRVHKISLDVAEKIMDEFKCYNEKLRLRHPGYEFHQTLDKKKNLFNKSTHSNSKSPPSNKLTAAQKVANSKLKSVLFSKKADLKKIQDIKMRVKELIKKGKKLQLSEKDKTKKVRTLASPLSQRNTLSSPSSTKKPNLSNAVKKKEKMKHTSKDSIKKAAAKKLITKSRNYFGKNAPSRLLRSNKK